MSPRHVALWLAALAAVTGLPAPVAAQPTVTDPNVTIAPYASGLSAPTQIRFLGANDLFVTEKNTGRVQRVQNGVTTTALDLNVANDSERGLLGIALSPNFATNNQVYLYYSATSGADGGAWTDNRLQRYLWNGTSLAPDATFAPVIISSAADGQANGPNHDGGPITFGPDGKLYGIVGDLNRNALEQNNQSQATVSSRVGGIYRLNADGSIPSDNPFVGASTNPAVQKWYAYGVRNSYGLTFDPATGNLWQTENGPTNYDEINRVPRGFNSGWNKLMGPAARQSQGPFTTADLVSLPGSVYRDPDFSFLTPPALTGISFLTNSSLAAAGYGDAVLVGSNNFGELYLFRLDAARDTLVMTGAGLADRVADSTAERNLVRFGQGFSAITDIQVGPDGGVYVTDIGTGTIYRLTAVPEPGTLALGLAAAAGLALVRRRRRPGDVAEQLRG